MDAPTTGRRSGTGCVGSTLLRAVVTVMTAATTTTTATTATATAAIVVADVATLYGKPT